MIAGAIVQHLAASGLSARIGGFGDYTKAGPPAVAVSSRVETFAEMGTHAAYTARVQIRSRAADVIQAHTVAEQATALFMALDGATVTWTPPGGGASRQYRLEAIAPINLWNDIATPEPGEETTSNFHLHVTEV